MVDVSIVSGTYNRLPSLQKMVASVRQSFTGLHGLAYEIVLVDGGSQDGTQEWCKAQPDVRLIEHGELRGAVKAFNDGAYAASGEYVILANDDIEFVGKSVLVAWLYMQDHPDCGIGCFYQDRNGRDWHIEEMPCVENGQQVHRPYGQVCIVPKWLGDKVGWWGDYLHTYGGDNEISSQVYQTGFKVSPVPEAKIHDREAMDDLRKINNINGGSDPRAVRGHHPDSWAWGKHWRNEAANLVGPVIRPVPMFEQQTKRRERVVYLPIYEAGWDVQKEQKRGLREALSRVAVVTEFDYVSKSGDKSGMLDELFALCDQVKPTIFLSQLHNGSVINADDITWLRGGFPNTRFLNWNGDYWPENLLSEDGIKLARAFELQLVINREAIEKYRTMGIQADYWQIGFEPDGVGHPPDVFRDVVFLASGYSKARRSLVRQLRTIKVDFGLYGSGWPDGWSKGQCMYDFVTACKLYRGAKISIGDSQWPDSGFVSNRVFQALAAGGSALAHQYFKDMDKLGLVDGQTCIIWQDVKELKDKIAYYLSHENDRRRIAEAGEKLALMYHSFDKRVEELFRMLQLESQEESWR